MRVRARTRRDSRQLHSLSPPHLLVVDPVVLLALAAAVAAAAQVGEAVAQGVEEALFVGWEREGRGEGEREERGGVFCFLLECKESEAKGGADATPRRAASVRLACACVGRDGGGEGERSRAGLTPLAVSAAPFFRRQRKNSARRSLFWVSPCAGMAAHHALQHHPEHAAAPFEGQGMGVGRSRDGLRGGLRARILSRPAPLG